MPSEERLIRLGAVRIKASADELIKKAAEEGKRTRDNQAAFILEKWAYDQNEQKKSY